MIALRLFLSSVLLIGCETDAIVAPTHATGHWRLVAIDDEPVAGKLALAEDGAPAQIDSGEIIFRRYGRLQDIRHLWRQGLFGPPQYFSDSAIAIYMVRSDSIFVRRARYLSSEEYVDTGVIAGTTMEIAVRGNPPSSGAFAFARWKYTRIGETPP